MSVFRTRRSRPRRSRSGRGPGGDWRARTLPGSGPDHARPEPDLPDRAGGAPLLLVGFDMSRSSRHALAYAAGAARRMHATLLVVYVCDTAPVPAVGVVSLPLAGGIAPIGYEPTPPRQVEHTTTAAQQCATDALAGSDVAWRFVVRHGPAAAELDRLATEHHADSLVTGRSGRLARWVCGSVPARLVRRARCPVIVVP